MDDGGPPRAKFSLVGASSAEMTAVFFSFCSAVQTYLLVSYSATVVLKP